MKRADNRWSPITQQMHCKKILNPFTPPLWICSTLANHQINSQFFSPFCVTIKMNESTFTTQTNEFVSYWKLWIKKFYTYNLLYPIYTLFSSLHCFSMASLFLKGSETVSLLYFVNVCNSLLTKHEWKWIEMNHSTHNTHCVSTVHSATQLFDSLLLCISFIRLIISTL